MHFNHIENNKFSTQANSSSQSRSSASKNQHKRKTFYKMVKLAVLFTAGLAALTNFVAADSCKSGIEYCGYNLLHKGE